MIALASPPTRHERPAQNKTMSSKYTYLCLRYWATYSFAVPITIFRQSLEILVDWKLGVCVDELYLLVQFELAFSAAVFAFDNVSSDPCALYAEGY